MGRWGRYGADAKKAQPAGKYAKLRDGDRLRYALTEADPVQRIGHWLDGKRVPEGTHGAERSVKIMLCVYDLDAQECRVLEVTPRTFETICAKAEKFREDERPSSWEISRNKGSNGFPVYDVDRLDPLTPEQAASVKASEPYDLLQEQGTIPMPSDDLGPPDIAPQDREPPPVGHRPRRQADVRPAGRPSAMPEPAAVPDEDTPF
jgi:hypothetical protein